MGVIDKYFGLTRPADFFQSPGNLFEHGNPFLDGLHRDSKRHGGSNGSQNIVEIEPADQR